MMLGMQIMCIPTNGKKRATMTPFTLTPSSDTHPVFSLGCIFIMGHPMMHSPEHCTFMNTKNVNMVKLGTFTYSTAISGVILVAQQHFVQVNSL